MDLLHVLSDSKTCLVAVHLWHVAVHEDELVDEALGILLLNHLHGLKTVVGGVNSVLELDVWPVGGGTLENDSKSIQDEGLVVHDQDSFLNYRRGNIKDFMLKSRHRSFPVNAWQVTHDICWHLEGPKDQVF